MLTTTLWRCYNISCTFIYDFVVSCMAVCCTFLCLARSPSLHQSTERCISITKKIHAIAVPPYRPKRSGICRTWPTVVRLRTKATTVRMRCVLLVFVCLFVHCSLFVAHWRMFCLAFVQVRLSRAGLCCLVFCVSFLFCLPFIVGLCL